MDLFTWRGPLSQIVLRKFRLREDSAHQIVEIMRDTTRQCTEAFQLLSGERLLLDTLEIRDVDSRTDIAGENPTWPKTGYPLVQHPSELSVHSTQPVFHLEVSAEVKRRSLSGETAVKVIGMNTLGPAVAEFLLHGATREDQPAFVEKSEELVRAGCPDHYRR